MFNSKEDQINQEIEDLINIYGRGGGFGDPDAQKEHEWKIKQLQHKQSLIVAKKVKVIEIASVLIALCSLILTGLQLWNFT